MKREIIRLVHERARNCCEYCQLPAEHFRLSAEELIGISDVGRTTVDVLRINDIDSLTLQRSLIDEGIFPPKRI